MFMTDRMLHVHTDDYLAAWNERLLVDYLDDAAAKHSDRVAIVDFEYGTGGQIELTFSELRQRVDRIAWSLIGLNVKRGDIVSVQLPNWWHFVAVHLACLRIGATTNPLMPIFRERELTFMLGLAESRIVIVPKTFRDFDHEAMIERIRPSLPALRHVIVVNGAGPNSFDRQLLSAAVPANAARIFAAQRPTADDVVQLLYTSGTTGEPKGVMHTSRTLLTTMLPSIRHVGLVEGEPILSATPLAHQLGFIMALIVPIVLASPIVMQDVWNAGIALTRIRKHGVTFGMGATPFLADLIESAAQEGDAGSLRTFLSAGAPIPRMLVKRARQEIGVKVLSAYGMTENLLVSAARPDDPEQKFPKPTAHQASGSSCASSTRMATGFRPASRDDCRRAAPARSSAISSDPSCTMSITRAGSIPAISLALMPTVTSPSPDDGRTSSSEAARTFRSSRSRMCSTGIPRCARSQSLPCPTSDWESGPALSWSCVRPRPSRFPRCRSFCRTPAWRAHIGRSVWNWWMRCR
jgi:acyl-CoA synthetase (AMP-forming)/AMP-acid ligase II